MRRAVAVVPAGMPSDLPTIDTLLLEYQHRQRPHGWHTTLRGLQVEMALRHSYRLKTDDRLVLDDDTLIEIVARPEPLYEIRAANVSELARIAWMLGDRHLPVEMAERRLRVRRDPVVNALLKNGGMTFIEIDAPFEPEGGAYAHHRRGG